MPIYIPIHTLLLKWTQALATDTHTLQFIVANKMNNHVVFDVLKMIIAFLNKYV